MFMFDVETLSVESNCVILSAALLHFDPNENPSYQDMLDNALFVKIDAKDQIKRLGRTVDQGTLDWWKQQHEYPRKISFDPSADDITSEEAVQLLINYMDRYDRSRKQTVWARGSLDQMCIDSLSRKVDLQPFTTYNMWRDVRTAIDILYGTTNGYCEIEYPGFERASVIKHHPVHDCALDAMMLMYGRSNA